ncbi:MAG: hypothetical protein F4120_06540 [Rhodothermaceae bacterium]|nr:hypothetical protein [Rhodothermaceae bacterium]MXW33160.1 hypothetical protein [Rhodothermaceae bacterium]MYC05486.1 hypothetical protein [Rhodothermaceae bacterium]MYE62601.1 hypothetical protein [Rhodothermaceae bacterium]MYI17266.1 hypothetical protein [Rhodothermaceae bacterium]
MEYTNRRWRVAVRKTGRDGIWDDRGVWMGKTLYGAIHAYQLAGERADWERTAWESLGRSRYYRVIDEDDSAYVFHVKPA